MIDPAFLAFLAIVVFLLAIGGAVMDHIDPFNEHEDAERRNRP